MKPPSVVQPVVLSVGVFGVAIRWYCLRVWLDSPHSFPVYRPAQYVTTLQDPWVITWYLQFIPTCSATLMFLIFASESLIFREPIRMHFRHNSNHRKCQTRGPLYLVMVVARRLEGSLGLRVTRGSVGRFILNKNCGHVHKQTLYQGIPRAFSLGKSITHIFAASACRL